jgi:hypothetical protein
MTEAMLIFLALALFSLGCYTGLQLGRRRLQLVQSSGLKNHMMSYMILICPIVSFYFSLIFFAATILGTLPPRPLWVSIIPLVVVMVYSSTQYGERFTRELKKKSWAKPTRGKLMSRVRASFTMKKKSKTRLAHRLMLRKPGRHRGRPRIKISFPQQRELQRKIRKLHKDGWSFYPKRVGDRIYIRAVKTIDGERKVESLGPHNEAAQVVFENLGIEFPRHS